MTTPVIPPAITKELTKIDGEPDYPKMTVLRREIYGNAIAHHSLRGGGTHGHLGMIEPPAEYLLHNGHAFIAPAHPGLLPPPNPNATAAQINEAYRQYLIDVSEFTNYHTIGETCPSGRGCHHLEGSDGQLRYRRFRGVVPPFWHNQVRQQ
jgi:hypothetical protein